MGNNNSHNESVLQSLLPGDRVKFHRGLYSHWGIYIGEEKIIHFGGNKGEKAAIMIDKFWDVVKQGIATKNNDKDAIWSPMPSEEIIERARSLLGKGRQYNLFTENCEHFVNWCRYGQRVSEQANGFIGGLAVCGMAATIPLAIAATAPVENDAKKTRKRKLVVAAAVTAASLGLAADVSATNEANKHNKTVEYEPLRKVFVFATAAVVGGCEATALTMLK